MHDHELDLGAQVAYLVLEPGTPVYCSGTEVGRVSDVLAAGNDDIFDGIEVQAGMHQHYVMADSIEAIYERGVVLAISEDSLKALGSRPGA